MPESLFKCTSFNLKVELELISDADMYLFFEKDMRGIVYDILEIFLISKANNKYIKSYDPKQASKHIIDLDANNLYGYAMSTFLPTGRIKWIDHKAFDSDKYSGIIQVV